jgi:hypothetical protein
MAVKFDTRKDALMLEMKVEFDNERKKIAERIALTEQEK